MSGDEKCDDKKKDVFGRIIDGESAETKNISRTTDRMK